MNTYLLLKIKSKQLKISVHAVHYVKSQIEEIKMMLHNNMKPVRLKNYIFTVPGCYTKMPTCQQSHK